MLGLLASREDGNDTDHISKRDAGLKSYIGQFRQTARKFKSIALKKQRLLNPGS